MMNYWTHGEQNAYNAGSFAKLNNSCSVLPISLMGKEGWPWVDSDGINILQVISVCHTRC